MITAAANCMQAGAAMGATGSGHDHPFIADAALSSLMNSAASTDVVSSRLIEWAAPAPGWLLAFSSAAFFLLAFFAFSQYRKRVPRTLSSGEDEGSIGSGSSDPAVTSLPNASGGRVPEFLFPALASRTAETYVNAAPPALAFGYPEPLPVRRCADVYPSCENIFYLHDSSALQPSTTFVTSTRTPAAGGTSFDASSDALAVASFNNFSVARAADKSAAGASATAAAAARALSVTGTVLPAENNFRDGAAAPKAAIHSQDKYTTDVNTGHSAADIVASKYTGNAAAATDNLGLLAEVPPSMSTTPSSSLWNTATPPLSAKDAVSGAATARYPRCSDDCRSIKGRQLLRGDVHPMLGGRRAVIIEQAVASSYSFKRASLDAGEVPTAMARLPAVTSSSSSSFNQTDAAAVCGSAAIAADCGSSSPCGTTVHPAFVPLADLTSAASRASAAAKNAGGFCNNCASESCSSSLDRLADFPASSSRVLLQREVVLHAAAPPEGRRWRYSERRFRALANNPRKSRDEEHDGASAAPTERKMSKEVYAIAAREGCRKAAATAYSAVAAGPRGRGIAADGGETETAESGNTTEAIEEKEYASLAGDEEDVSAAPCAASRTTFTFDGASMRSVILAVITAAALLRALLLLLQLVANPLESKRPAPPRAVSCLPVRSSFLPASPGMWRDATAVFEEGSNIVNDDADATALSFPHAHLSRDAVSMTPDLSATRFGPQLPSPAAPESLFFPAAEMGSMLTSSTAASNTSLLRTPDETHAVASTVFSDVNYDATSTASSHHLEEPPSFSPASLKAGLSPPGALPASSSAAVGTTSAASTPLFPVGTTASVRMLLLPSETSPTVSSPMSLMRARILQVLPMPQHSSASMTKGSSKPEAEIGAVSAATPATTAGGTSVLSSTTSTDKTSHPQVPPGPNMPHSLIATGTLAADEVTAAASAAERAAATLQEQTDKQHHDLSPIRNASHVTMEGNALYGALEGGHDVVAGHSSSSSSSPPRDNSGAPVSSSSTDNSSSAVRSIRSSVNLNSSNVKNMGDSSVLTSRDRNKAADVVFEKWASSTRDDGRRRMAARRKKPRSASSRSRPARKNMRKFTQSKRSSVPRNTPATRSRSGSGAKGGRTGWPSGLWLRTLARSLPPMLCVKAYALLILFLLDLYYASSRLENVRWIAVGSYVFLGGVWVLFASVAGLTVAEDNTRREAAHLFARSICWLLGFCFTLLSISLAVVGSLVLKQLRGRKSMQLFFRPPMVVDQPVGSADGLLQAVVASDVYGPSRSCLQFAPPTLQGDATAYLPPTASQKGMSRVLRECCVTQLRDGDEEALRDNASPPASRVKSWLPACLAKYWSANPPATPVAAALPEEECAGKIHDDAAANMPLQHDLENQQRGDTQLLYRVFGLGWIERRQQQLAEQEVRCRSLHATRDATNHREGRNAFLLPVNCFFLSWFKKSADASPCEVPSPTSYSTAWRRLFTLTLCCPPLLMMRGIHLLLVGAQIFPHYYPSFVEEKGTFDVFIYLITEWLPLTLLVCASSHTATSKQRSNSLIAHATLLDDACGASFRAMQAPFLHPSQSLFSRCHYCRRDTAYTSLWPHQSKGNSGGSTACIHQPCCLFSTPFCNASVCASQVQPRYEKQYTAQDQQRDVDKERARKVQRKRLCDVKKEESGLRSMAFHVDDLASQKFSELSAGKHSSKTKTWRRLFCRRGKGNSEHSRETKCEARSSDERFGVPLLTDDVLSGPQALRLAHQQHGSSSSSSSSSSRRDSDGQ